MRPFTAERNQSESQIKLFADQLFQLKGKRNLETSFEYKQDMTVFPTYYAFPKEGNVTGIWTKNKISSFLNSTSRVYITFNNTHFQTMLKTLITYIHTTG